MSICEYSSPRSTLFSPWMGQHLVEALECDGGAKSVGCSGLDAGSVLARIGNVGLNALFQAKHPMRTVNLSHSEIQRRLWSKRTWKYRNKRKSPHGQLRCSPADNTHPTLEPLRRGDAWLRSGRLIPTDYDDSLNREEYLKKAAQNLNITVELACALHPRGHWTREEANKPKVRSEYFLAIFG